MKKKQYYVSMRAFFIFFFICEFILIDLFAFLLVTLLSEYVSFINKIPKIVWLIIVSVVLGCAVTAFMAKYFFSPIMKIGNAMQRVAGGELDVKLSTKTHFRELKEIHSDFNSMTEKLASTEILQTEFISNVSHEFKTPINAIEGYATLLQDSDGEITQEQQEYIEKILFNTKRLTSLVGNILLLSKVDSGNIPSNCKEFRLDEQIRLSIVSLESLWTKKETEFDVDLEAIKYYGPENLLMHVWNNLIENAIKYGPQKGLVSVKLIKRDDNIIFTVDDEGPGISKEAQKHIFDRFYQEDNSRKTQGNGLGLALVKRIIKIIGGDIKVENLPEKGTRFTVVVKDTKKEL